MHPSNRLTKFSRRFLGLSRAGHARRAIVALVAIGIVGGCSTSANEAETNTNVAALDSSTNEGYVASLYRDLLGREPDVGGYTYWVSQLNSGTLRRQQVLDGFLASDEYRAVDRTYAYCKNDQGGISLLGQGCPNRTAFVLGGGGPGRFGLFIAFADDSPTIFIDKRLVSVGDVRVCLAFTLATGQTQRCDTPADWVTLSTLLGYGWKDVSLSEARPPSTFAVFSNKLKAGDLPEGTFTMNVRSSDSRWQESVAIILPR
jgi:hypothetical protein